MLKRSTFALVAFAAALCAVGFSSQVRAEDEAADYTGTWKWTAMMRNNSVEFTADFKQEGDAVTGSISGGAGGGQSTEIKDGKVVNGEITFKVVRTRGGNEITTTYTGKLDGDTIKGKIETSGGTTTRPARDWTATRAKAAAGGDAK
jgi:hypothetical protein